MSFDQSNIFFGKSNPEVSELYIDFIIQIREIKRKMINEIHYSNNKEKYEGWNEEYNEYHLVKNGKIVAIFYDKHWIEKQEYENRQMEYLVN